MVFSSVTGQRAILWCVWAYGQNARKSRRGVLTQSDCSHLGWRRHDSDEAGNSAIRQEAVEPFHDTAARR